MPNEPSNVVSIRAQNVEKNAQAISAAADTIIECFNTILRLTGMKHATVLAVSCETNQTTHEITCTPVGDSK